MINLLQYGTVIWQKLGALAGQGLLLRKSTPDSGHMNLACVHTPRLNHLQIILKINN